MNLHPPLIGRRSAAGLRRSSARRCLRPWVEALEDRTVLSTLGAGHAAAGSAASLPAPIARSDAHAHVALAVVHHNAAQAKASSHDAIASPHHHATHTR